MHTVSRFNNVAKTLVQQSTCENIAVGVRFASKKRREDCLDDKKTEDKKDKSVSQAGAEACVDLNFKKKEVSIYDDAKCLPPRFQLDKDCSTVKPKKVSCNTKKRNIPTGCRKYSMYTDVQKSFTEKYCGYKNAGFQKKIFKDDLDYLYKTKNRCEGCDPTANIQKSCREKQDNSKTKRTS